MALSVMENDTLTSFCTHAARADLQLLFRRGAQTDRLNLQPAKGKVHLLEAVYMFFWEKQIHLSLVNGDKVTNFTL